MNHIGPIWAAWCPLGGTITLAFLWKMQRNYDQYCRNVCLFPVKHSIVSAYPRCPFRHSGMILHICNGCSLDGPSHINKLIWLLLLSRRMCVHGRSGGTIIHTNDFYLLIQRHSIDNIMLSHEISAGWALNQLRGLWVSAT